MMVLTAGRPKHIAALEKIVIDMCKGLQNRKRGGGRVQKRADLVYFLHADASDSA